MMWFQHVCEDTSQYSADDAAGNAGLQERKGNQLVFPVKEEGECCGWKKEQEIKRLHLRLRKGGKKGKIEKQNGAAAQSHCSYQRGKKYSSDREYRKFHQNFLLYVSRIFAALYKIRMEKLIFSRKTGILFKHHAPHTEPRSAGTKKNKLCPRERLPRR